jgi:hypothetical protein
VLSGGDLRASRIAAVLIPDPGGNHNSILPNSGGPPAEIGMVDPASCGQRLIQREIYVETISFDFVPMTPKTYHLRYRSY